MIGIGIIFIPFVHKPESQFEKSLKYIAVGSLIFFLFYTLRGYVHLHWTSILLFPVIILSVRYYSLKRNNKLFISLVIPFLIVILIARLYLGFQIFPVNTLHVDYYHGRKLWAEDIKAIAGNRPVVFETGNGALREAPLYTFYSKGLGIALYAGDNKKSQYQIWNYEDSIQSEDVILIRGDLFEGSRAIKTRMGKSYYYKEFDDFTSFNNIKIICNEKDIVFENDSIKIPLQIINHRTNPIVFNSMHRIFISLINEEKEEISFEQTLNNGLSVKAGDTAKLQFAISLKTLDKSQYDFKIGLNDGITDPTLNNKRNKLLITKSK
jgi:hypothetical protein